MTPLPKRKLSRARQGRRRSSIRLNLTTLALCPNCHQPKKPYELCPNCGFYNGRQIITPKQKTKKHEKSA